MPNPTLENIVALAKRRGFVFPTSSIYGGLANCYDYGPLGVELLRNIKNAWWREFITQRADMLGLDSQILLHPETWVASGHVGSFADPLVDDLKTGKRYRADHLIEAWLEKQPTKTLQTTPDVSSMSVDEMGEFITTHKLKSPDGNPLSAPKSFNLLFETAIGAVAGDKSKVYLRGETAQGIFTNFKHVLDSTRTQLPFGVGQIGKSFRNEVTTGQFVFRTLEFEQAEIEYFFNPETAKWQDLFEGWKDSLWAFVNESLGVNQDNLRWRQHSDKERSFYSKETYDLDYRFPFGWQELWGLAYRGDYDLKQHIDHSGEKLEYTDPQTNKSFIPHVIEPAVGINRLFLMILNDAYWADEENKRTVLKLKPSLAPYTAAIFPLVRNKPDLMTKAEQLFAKLIKNQNLRVTFDKRGNIGKRYLAQDEIGTPFCITVDHQTVEDDTVTVRQRDTREQSRVNLDKLEQYLVTMLK